jgi:hypothetical protein
MYFLTKFVFNNFSLMFTRDFMLKILVNTTHEVQ